MPNLLVNLEKIQLASKNVRKIIPPSPLLYSAHLSTALGRDVYLKMESLNKTGSFKIRGAANALINFKSRSADGSPTVVAASAGNHAQAVAYMCRELGMSAKIFMPETAPLVKIQSTKSFGAEVIIVGETLLESYNSAVEEARRLNALLLDAFGDADVIAGQGSAGLEILEQCPDVGGIIVPIGGGGLIGGIACAVKEQRPGCFICGVQSEAYSAFKESFDSGQLVKTEARPTISDGIAVKLSKEINLSLAKQFVDDVMLVSEEETAAAIMKLMESCRVLAEGAGATSVAILERFQKKHYKRLGSSPIVCVISGGNIDVNLLGKIVSRALVFTGRRIQIRAEIGDRPGGLAGLLQLIAKAGANLIEVHHDRTYSMSPYSQVEVELDIETESKAHQEKLFHSLREQCIKFAPR